MKLKNKNILITGSTRGIGLALAQDCLKHEANIVIHGTNQEKVDELRKTQEILSKRILNFEKDNEFYKNNDIMV